jgi:tetratricopeptide (TPR) repeat protein
MRARCVVPDIPVARRLAVCIVSLAIAAVAFRAQVAGGLVSRGDDFLQSGNPRRAQSFYDRALRIDAGSVVAAERFSFVALMLRDRNSLQRGVAVASRAFATDPSNEALLVDRALCWNALRSYREAARDFEALAVRTSDARYFEFAAQTEKRAGNTARAARLFATVLALVPRFVPARRELALLREKR